MFVTITASHGATDISDGTTTTTLKTRQSTSDSADPNQVSGKSSSKETIKDRPAWTAYWNACAKFMAPRTSQLITLIETGGGTNRPVK